MVRARAGRRQRARRAAAGDGSKRRSPSASKRASCGDATIAQSERSRRARCGRCARTSPKRSAARARTSSTTSRCRSPRSPRSCATPQAALAAALPGVRFVTFGHLGDGNLHYNLAAPEGVAAARFMDHAARANRIVHDLVARARRQHQRRARHRPAEARRARRATRAPVELELMRADQGRARPAGHHEPGQGPLVADGQDHLLDRRLLRGAVRAALVNVAKAQARATRAREPPKPTRRPSRWSAASSAASFLPQAPTPGPADRLSLQRPRLLTAALTNRRGSSLITRRCSPPPRSRRSSRRRCRRRWPTRAAASCGSSPLSRGLRRRSLLGIALLLDLQALSVVDAEHVRHRQRALLPVRARRVLVGAAATAAAVAAADAVAARCSSADVFFLALVDRRRRHVGRAAADPAVPAARRRAAGCCARRRRSSTPRSRRVVPARPRPVPRARRADRRHAARSRPALIGFGYFATVGIAVALGRYTKASEDLAAQRGIDVANLEQVNRLIIQDMQDGVLVVDLNGVVRGHNAQVTRLLGGFGRMRGGMRLSEFSSTLHDYWRRWQEDFTESLPPFGRGDAAAAARAPGAHRLGTQRRHADLSRGPRPRADRGAADEARGDGPADRVDRARGAQSAVGDQPGGAAARGGRRGRARGHAPAQHDPQQRAAHRPHRRRGAAAQPPRPPAARDRSRSPSSCAR